MFYRHQQVILHLQSSSETALADHVDTSDHAQNVDLFPVLNCSTYGAILLRPGLISLHA